MSTTYKKTRDDVFIVKGSGNASTDNTRIAAAVAAANAYGRGTILFDGTASNHEVFVTTEHVFTAPIGLECVKGTFVVRDSASGAFSWGATQDAWDYTTGTFSSAAAGDTVIVSPTGLTLAKGNYVVVWADNNLTDITNHSASQPQRPMEIHKISRQVAATNGTGVNEWLFNDWFDDPFTTSPQLAVIPMLEGIRIRNFNARVSANVIGVSLGRFLAFNRCANLELTDLTLGNPFPGQIGFRYCYDVRRNGIWFGELQKFNDEAPLTNYGMVDMVVNGAVTADCRFHGLRHACTTGGLDRVISGTTYRYGGPKNRLFTSCRFGNNQQQLYATSSWTSMPMLDFHAEGKRDVVDNCTFVCPTTPSQSYNQTALNARARDVVVKNSTFFSNNGSYVAYIRGRNQIWKNNVFRGGLLIQQDTALGANANVDNIKFIGNTFDSMQQGLRFTTGTGHEIIDNKFINCGSVSTGTMTASLIYVASLTDSNSRIRIIDNYMRKYSNTYSVDTTTLTAAQVYLSGNEMSGYTNASIGLNRSRTATPELELCFASQNNRCQINYQYVSATSHGLSASDVNKPITTGHAVYDDTGTTAIAGILADVIDTNTYVLYPLGSLVTLPISVYPGAVTGDAYWDKSPTPIYVNAKPAGSVSPVIMRVTFVNANFIQGRISTSL